MPLKISRSTYLKPKEMVLLRIILCRSDADDLMVVFHRHILIPADIQRTSRYTKIHTYVLGLVIIIYVCVLILMDFL